MQWFSTIFRKKEELPRPANNKKRLDMDYIEEAIFNHLNMKTTGALMLTGDWGSGKTYHIKNNVFPKIESENKFIPIIVSLYGEMDKNNIAQKVLFAFIDKKGEGLKVSAGSIAKNIKNVSDSIPLLKKYVDLEKLLIGTGDNIFKLLPHDKLFICFDDIERMSDKIDVNDFLGIINDLVENKGCKVLLIANEEKIKNGITFKEKTIEKTIHFSPNISLIFDNIAASYDESPFKQYLIANKKLILLTLTSKVDNVADENELKKSFSNIRTLKFAIEHFKYVFLLMSSVKNVADDLTKTQLKNLWLFILSISVEFRKPNNISYNIKNNLDKQSPGVTGDISLANFFNTEEEPIEENDMSYSKKFIQNYYSRISENYIYYSHVYDLITSGKEINKEEFIIQVDVSFKVKEGKVNPAHEILFKMLHSGYWSYTNEQFPVALKNLLKYAEQGAIEDIVSYLNAGTYLLEFHDIIGVKKPEIVSKLKHGLEIFLESIKLNTYLIDQFEMVTGSFHGEEMKDVISFIIGKNNEIKERLNALEAAKLEEMFVNNIESFIDQFRLDGSGIRTPDSPTFHEFSLARVKEALAKWEPNSIMNVSLLLKIRYLDSSFAEMLTDEIPFLNNLEQGIAELKLAEETLSSRIIGKYLLPNIKASKDRLQHFAAPKTGIVL